MLLTPCRRSEDGGACWGYSWETGERAPGEQGACSGGRYSWETGEWAPGEQVQKAALCVCLQICLLEARGRLCGTAVPVVARAAVVMETRADSSFPESRSLMCCVSVAVSHLGPDLRGAVLREEASSWDTAGAGSRHLLWLGPALPDGAGSDTLQTRLAARGVPGGHRPRALMPLGFVGRPDSCSQDNLAPAGCGSDSTTPLTPAVPAMAASGREAGQVD